MADEAVKQRKRERRRRRRQLEQRSASARAAACKSPANRADNKREKQRKIEEKDITGLKYFEKLNPLLNRLHEDGCERDKANNRDLHFDQYCMLVLLYLFNPIVTSLRGIQQASELEKVQRKLGCPRVRWVPCRKQPVFDAERLKEIIHELGEDLQPVSRDSRLRTSSTR